MSVTAKKRSPKYSTADFTPEQARFAAHLKAHDRTMGVLQAGFGKTATTLDALVYRLADGSVNRVLVLAPLRPAKNWLKEWFNFGFDETGLVIAEALGSEAKRRAAFASGAPIVVLNNDNIVWAASAGLLDDFDGIVIDELSKFKAVGGAAFKRLRRVVKRCTFRVGLSATPVAEGLRWLYGQTLLLDDGERFGTSQEKFLWEWCYPTDYEQRNWEAKPASLAGMLERLNDLLYCDDADYRGSGLPALDLRYVRFDLPVPVRDLMHELDQTDVCEVTLDETGELAEVVGSNRAVITNKLLQMASGFVYTDDGVATLHTRKTAMVRRYVERCLREGLNVAVAYQYQWEADQLKRMYPDIVDVREKDAEARWQAGEVPVLMLHPKSGGHGLNLQAGGHVLVVWSLPWSLDNWDQMIRRFLRRGQTAETVRVWVPVARESKDEDVIARLEKKLAVQDDFNVAIKALKVTFNG